MASLSNKEEKKAPNLVNTIKLFETFPCSKISAGEDFSVALTSEHGRVYTWGSG